MAKHMRGAMWAGDAGPVQGSAYDASDCDPTERDDGCDVGQEHTRGCRAWPRPTDIGEKRISDLLRQRQGLPAPCLAPDGQCCSIPVDLREVEVRDLTRPEPEPQEKQYDSTVAQAFFSITGVEYAREVWRGEEAWRRRELPVREAWNGVVQPGPALARCDQVPQERAGGDRDRLRMTAAMRRCSFQHERAAGRSRVPGRIVAKRIQQIGDDSAAQVERGLRDATLLAHPRPIGSEQGPGLLR